MPVQDRLDMLLDSIAALLLQTMTDFELLIVDDASDEDIPAFLKNFNDNRIRYIRSSNLRESRLLDGTKNGEARARNRGIEHASAEYIAFMDSDDLPDPTWLEELCAALDAEPLLDMVYTDYLRSMDGTLSGEYRCRDFTSAYDMLMLLMSDNVIPNPGRAFRKRAFEKICFDEIIPGCCDYDLNIKFCKAGMFARRIASPLWTKRWSANQLTGSPCMMNGKAIVKNRHFSDLQPRLEDVDGFPLAAPKATWKIFDTGMVLTEEPTSPYRYVYGSSCRVKDKIDRYFDGAKVKVLHWCGTDVLHAKWRLNVFRSMGCHHLVEWYGLQEELASVGVVSEVVVSSCRHRPAVQENRGDSVAFYVPTGREWRFFGDLMRHVAKQCGRGIVWLPRSDKFDRIDDIFSRCSHYVRFVDHDGFSMLSAEMMMSGGAVVTNQNRPYQHQVEPDADAILDALHKPPDPKAAHYYRYITDPIHVITKMRGYIDDAERAD